MSTQYQNPYQPPHARGNLPLGVLLGVIVGAVAVMLVWFLFVDDPDTATPAPVPTQTQPIERSSEPRPTPSDDPTPSPSATAEDSPSPEQPATPIPGITTELPVGTWVTVLDSLPQGSVSAEEAIERARNLTPPGHDVIVMDTNHFGGLNPNYWAVVIPGAESRAASNDVCRAIGIPVGNKCYPREIKG